MQKYHIQQRISTLSENAVGTIESEPEFSAENIKFTQWEFDHGRGWLGDAWLAESFIESECAFDALVEFSGKMAKLIPKISFIGQAYIQYHLQPFLLTKGSSNLGFFYFPMEVEPVGLMFLEEQKKALDILLSVEQYPKEFFLYWNDAVNTTGYSSKLLVMFSAIEALISQQGETKRRDLLTEIFGEEDKALIYAQRTGLRHRLVHGAYYSDQDKINFVELVHAKVISFFNRKVFCENLIEERIIHPQRNFSGNKQLHRYWIKQIQNDFPLDLKFLLSNIGERDLAHVLRSYKIVSDDNDLKNF